MHHISMQAQSKRPVPKMTTPVKTEWLGYWITLKKVSKGKTTHCKKLHSTAMSNLSGQGSQVDEY